MNSTRQDENQELLVLSLTHYCLGMSYWLLSQRLLFNQLLTPPRKMNGLILTQLYFAMNITFMIGLIIISTILLINEEFSIDSKGVKKKSPHFLIRGLFGIFGLGVFITMFNAVSDWNLLVKTQCILFFIYGSLILIGVAINIKNEKIRYHVTTDSVVEKLQ